MGYDQFASNLIGTLRHELSVGDAIRGFLEGIVDGYDRFRAITNVVITIGSTYGERSSVRFTLF